MFQCLLGMSQVSYPLKEDSVMTSKDSSYSNLSDVCIESSSMYQLIPGFTKYSGIQAIKRHQEVTVSRRAQYCQACDHIPLN